MLRPEGGGLENEQIEGAGQEFGGGHEKTLSLVS
jgi:hypothetical protein